jgi:hypothetical protein
VLALAKNTEFICPFKSTQEHGELYTTTCTVNRLFVAYFWKIILEDYEYSPTRTKHDDGLDLTSFKVSCTLLKVSNDDITSVSPKPSIIPKLWSNSEYTASFLNRKSLNKANKIQQEKYQFDNLTMFDIFDNASFGNLLELKSKMACECCGDENKCNFCAHANTALIHNKIETTLKLSLMKAYRDLNDDVEEYDTLFSINHLKAGDDDRDADSYIVLEMMLYYYIMFKAECAISSIFENQEIGPESSMLLCCELFGANNESRISGFYEWWKIAYNHVKTQLKCSNVMRSHLEDITNDESFPVLPPTTGVEDYSKNQLSLLANIVMADKIFLGTNASALYVCEKMDSIKRGSDRIYDHFAFRTFTSSKVFLNNDTDGILYEDCCTLSDILCTLESLDFIFGDAGLNEVVDTLKESKKLFEDGVKVTSIQSTDTVVQSPMSMNNMKTQITAEYPSFMNR